MARWCLRVRLLLLWIVALVTAVSSLKRGRYDYLSLFCGEISGYASIPWDCSGYVHCVNTAGIRAAYWIQCPKNLFFDAKVRTCKWPKNLNKPCPPLKDTIDVYCREHPKLRFQNPDHCAQYYDCTDSSFSPKLGPYLKECPYPQLFDPFTRMCSPKHLVACGDRFTPMSKCDYEQHSGPNCKMEDISGCAGHPDGPNPNPQRILSPYYLICKNNVTVRQEMCKEGVFDPVDFKCTIHINIISIEVYCAAHPGEVAANPGHCARYIDCTTGPHSPYLGRHQRECSYPRLFSTMTKRCENFRKVQCGARQEPKAPCSYVDVLGNDTPAVCLAKRFTCRGLQDGANSLPGQTLQRKFLVCDSERVIEVKECPVNTMYDPVLKICAEDTEMGLLVRQCRETPKAIIFDPDHCARYFNCSMDFQLKGLKRFQQECDYPLLFNSQINKCDDFALVQCGRRYEPKAPCDYLSTKTKCTGPLCALPCEERSPSCVGYSNGNNTYPGRELSPFYMTCLGERTVSVGICRYGVYEPTLRRCASALELVSIERFCSLSITGIVPHYTNCARYYNCTAMIPAPGFTKYLQECSYPMLFDMDKLECVPYDQVKCNFRAEPKEACEYIANQQCPNGRANCNPCEQRIPSCAGLPNGNNTFIGRKNRYIFCQDDRTIAVKACVVGKYDPSRRACFQENFDYERPDKFCKDNPGFQTPHPLICSQYFDCSKGAGKYKVECPYPQLYHDVSKNCMPFADVQCGTRYEPREPCEYKANRKCPGGAPNCPPCRDRFPSCVGETNGNHSIIGRPRAYKECLEGRTMAVKTCAKGLFNPKTGDCSVEFDIRNPHTYCSVFPTTKVPNPNNCGQFYDCSVRDSELGNYLAECPYPQLFSTVVERCLPFRDVTCGPRPEPKAPCDYLENRKCKKAKCLPCNERFPSCLAKSDGDHQYPGKADHFIVCESERTIRAAKCSAGHFDLSSRKCIVTFDPLNPEIFCKIHTNTIIADETECAVFYDCSRPASRFGPYKHECPYPQLVESSTGKCVDYSLVICGKRRMPIGPCDYMQNTCVGNKLDCKPCEQRYASCVGLPDGLNPRPGFELTNYYITCKEQRTISVGFETCKSGYFDPINRICVAQLDASAILQYCRRNVDVIKANPLNCAQYFDCSTRSVTDGTFLRECPYPMMFSILESACKNFTEVTCLNRMEPRTPCQYLQNLCDPRDAGCIPCEQRYASCEGFPDGMNPYPGKGVSDDYIICENGRTVDTKKCPTGIFDPSSRTCGTFLDENTVTKYCEVNPTKIVPHPSNCAQYYDCRQAVAGSYLRECRYPQLFDHGMGICRNFTSVRCGERYEPHAPCEYLQNQCSPSDRNCEPCPKRLPSCRRFRNGKNPFPGRKSTEFYVKCFQKRTVAVEVCQVSLYDERKRECSNRINAAVLSRFCRENPNVMIPDPEHCNRYFNCSDPSVTPGLFIPHLQECKYPRLFAYGATECQLFEEVNCLERKEPMAPCQYMENKNQLFDVGVCDDNFPSCIGKTDGSNIFPGRENTEYYIVCYQQRTVAIVTCTVGSYDHGTRLCVEQPVAKKPTG